MRLWVMAICAVLTLGACVAPPVWAPDEAAANAAYRDNSPPRLTLITMTGPGGSGVHTSLLINGSQRVIFDPAGSFTDALVPERHDVLFGITPAALDRYIDYHTAPEFNSILMIQELDVSPEVAQAALRAVMSFGPVVGGKCSLSTSSVIASLPGFGNIQPMWYPLKFSEKFGEISGVKTRTINRRTPVE